MPIALSIALDPEDRTHERDIRSSCLPAICPARLPARDPSVTSTSSAGALRCASARQVRLRDCAPVIGRDHPVGKRGSSCSPAEAMAGHDNEPLRVHSGGAKRQQLNPPEPVGLGLADHCGDRVYLVLVEAERGGCKVVFEMRAITAVTV